MERLRSLDGIKGLGTAMVFLCHNRMAGLLPAKWADNTFFGFISDGNLAVSLLAAIVYLNL